MMYSCLIWIYQYLRLIFIPTWYKFWALTVSSLGLLKWNKMLDLSVTVPLAVLSKNNSKVQCEKATCPLTFSLWLCFRCSKILLDNVAGMNLNGFWKGNK